jgi:hypothetical protein
MSDIDILSAMSFLHQTTLFPDSFASAISAIYNNISRYQDVFVKTIGKESARFIKICLSIA